jgi:sulfofructosephosphate aldolase
MTDNQLTLDELLAPLRAESGGFAMVALDQRESLRHMFSLGDETEAGHVSDETLRAFKTIGIEVLSPLASGILLDRPLAVTTSRPLGIAPGCGLILAADILHQKPGKPVEFSEVDPLVTPEFIHAVGAVAIKLLVIWCSDQPAAEREQLVRAFVAVAEEAGVASLVEGIVLAPGGADWRDVGERHAAILDAAAELSSYGGSIYKAEVPGYVVGDLSKVREHAERLTEIVGGPWVVLSNGVNQPDFADAVREACLGGADGFLAGRAIWADTVSDDDTLAALRGRSRERLQRLSQIVAETRQS